MWPILYWGVHYWPHHADDTGWASTHWLPALDHLAGNSFAIWMAYYDGFF